MHFYQYCQGKTFSPNAESPRIDLDKIPSTIETKRQLKEYLIEKIATPDEMIELENLYDEWELTFGCTVHRLETIVDVPDDDAPVTIQTFRQYMQDRYAHFKIGIFCRDALADVNFPVEDDYRERVLHYLAERGADDEMIVLAELTFDLYYDQLSPPRIPRKNLARYKFTESKSPAIFSPYPKETFP